MRPKAPGECALLHYDGRGLRALMIGRPWARYLDVSGLTGIAVR